MSLTQPGVRSPWTEEDLNDMGMRSRLNHLFKDTKVFSEEQIKRIQGTFGNRDLVNLSYMPVGVEVGSESLPLPVVLLEEIIKRSKHRVVTKTCTCRHAEDCKDYDKHIGCIHIGEATWEESEGLSHHATVEEAIAHVHKAVDAGLMPFMGRFMPDHVLWDVSLAQPFLTVCFCCPCCCVMFNSYQKGHFTEETNSFGAHTLLDGVHFHVDESKCKACGKCAELCLTKCIELKDGKPVRDMSRCKGCCACSINCPEKAIDVTMDDVEGAVTKFLDRIKDQVADGLPADGLDLSRLKS